MNQKETMQISERRVSFGTKKNTKESCCNEDTNAEF